MANNDNKPKGKKTSAATESAARPARRRGRPPKTGGSQTPNISLEDIVNHAVKLAQTEGIPAISMVRVAKDLNVAPGLIHYYIGSIGDLVSAVINRAFKDRFEAMPEATGDWQRDLATLARSTVASMKNWPGLGTHVMTHTHFRLFQKVKSGETDYGLAYFDRFGDILEKGGFPRQQAALIYHIFNLFILTMIVEIENGQSPNQHAEFIGKYVAKYPAEQFSGAAYLTEAFAGLDGDTTFEQFMGILLQGFKTL